MTKVDHRSEMTVQNKRHITRALRNRKHRNEPQNYWKIMRFQKKFTHKKIIYSSIDMMHSRLTTENVYMLLQKSFFAALLSGSFESSICHCIQSRWACGNVFGES